METDQDLDLCHTSATPICFPDSHSLPALTAPGTTPPSQADLCASPGTLTRSHTLRHTLPFLLPTQPAALIPSSAPAAMAGMLLIHVSSPAAALPRPLALLRRTSLAHGGARSIYWCEVGYWGKCPLHSNEEKAAREQTRSKGSLFSFLGRWHMWGSGDVGEEGRSGVSQRQQ